MIEPRHEPYSLVAKNSEELSKIKQQAKGEEKVVNKIFVDTVTGEMSSEIRFDNALSRDRWQIVDVVFENENVNVETSGLTDKAASIVLETLSIMKAKTSRPVEGS